MLSAVSSVSRPTCDVLANLENLDAAVSLAQRQTLSSRAEVKITTPVTSEPRSKEPITTSRRVRSCFFLLSLQPTPAPAS